MTAPVSLPEIRIISVNWAAQLSDRQLDAPTFILERRTRWNDYGRRTLFHLILRRTPSGDKDLLIGPVKVLQRNTQVSSPPETAVHRLPEDFCSLGQSADYYNRLRDNLSPDDFTRVLLALRDITADPDIDASFQSDPGYTRSLMRAMEARRTYFFQLATGRPEEPSATFTYSCRLSGFDESHRIRFEFFPQDHQLGRIVALVGKNATGKTQLLRELGRKLSGLRDASGSIDGSPLFSRIVTIAYGAVDDFKRYEYWRYPYSGTSYYYCGLRNPNGEIDLGECRKQILARLKAMAPPERERWNAWLHHSKIPTTENPIVEVLDPDKPDRAAQYLDSLSAGHQIMVMVLTNLAATLRESSLVLFDEPEIHLHPNLLSSLMRILHSALEDTNSYAIIATHSPQVLQELPARAIRILERNSNIPSVRDYPRESFGANLSEIADFAFGIGEAWKNYRELLKDTAEHVTASRLQEILRMPYASLPLAFTLSQKKEVP